MVSRSPSVSPPHGVLPLFSCVWVGAALVVASYAGAAQDAAPGKLAAPITVHWREVPLREAANRLAQLQRICVWVDRRIDATKLITLSARNETVQSVLVRLAAQANAAAVWNDDVVYLGPPQTADELRTLLARSRQQVARLPTAASRRLRVAQPQPLERLAQPREVAQQLAERAGLRVENPDAIPHDLWPACELPAMSVAEQLTLLLAGFDLAWEASGDGASIRLVAIDRPVTVRQRHLKARVSRLPRELRDQLQLAAAPEPSEVWVTARQEIHEQIEQPQSQPTRSRSHQLGRQVYSLRVENQRLDAILEQLAKQLGVRLELAVDRESLSQRVTFEVREASIAELLQAAGRPAGLDITVEDGVIRVAK